MALIKKDEYQFFTIAFFFPNLLIAIYIFFGISKDYWFLVNSLSMPAPFADLLIITSNANCWATNHTWNLESPTCDPFGRPINYYSLFIKVVALLHIHQVSTLILGIFLGTIFCLTNFLLNFYLLSMSKYKKQIGITSLFYLSPPILLLLERGNSDILIYFLIMSGFLCRRNYKGIITLTFFSLSLLIKPFSACLLLYLFLSKNFNKFHCLIFSSWCLVVFMFVKDDLPIMYGRTFQILNLSFGPRQIFLISQRIFENEWIPPHLQIGYIFITAVLSFIALIPKFRITQTLKISKDQDLLLFSSVLFVGIFTMGNSYDLRLWSLAPFLYWLLNNKYWKISLLFVSSLYLSFLRNPLDWILDLALYPLVGIMGAYIVFIFFERYSPQLAAKYR